MKMSSQCETNPGSCMSDREFQSLLEATNPCLTLIELDALAQAKLRAELSDETRNLAMRLESHGECECCACRLEMLETAARANGKT